MPRSQLPIIALSITILLIIYAVALPEPTLAAAEMSPSQQPLAQSEPDNAEEQTGGEQNEDNSASAAQDTISEQDVLTETEAITTTQPITPNVAPTVTVAPQLELAIDMSLVNDVNSNESVDPGDTVRYRITYSNKGDGAANSVQLIGNYDQHFGVVRAENISGAGERAEGNVIWELGDLQVGATGSQSFDFQLNPSFEAGTASILIKATIESLEGSNSEENILSVIAAHALSISVERAPEIILDQGRIGIADPGDTLRMHVSYRNTGTADAANLVVTSDYAEALIGAIINISGGGVDNGSTVVWQIDRVEVGEKGQVGYDFELKSAMPSLTNKVETSVVLASADERDYDEDSDAFTVNASPRMSMNSEQKPAVLNDLNGNGQADPGDTVRYKIVYSNDGSAKASDVTVVDKYDARLIESIDNISNGGENREEAISWTLDEVKVGAEGQLSYDAVLVSRFPTGTTVIENEAIMESNDAENIRQGRSFTINVAPSPAIAANQQADSGVTVLGDTFSNVPWVPILFIAFMALLTLGMITYLANNDKDLNTIREPIYLVFIISSILVLTLADDLESDGAISILSAIVGYVFGRVTSSSS